MRILFLGSVFATENEEEVLENSKVAVEYSANNFQKKMIEGFKAVAEDFFVLSAPGIASFPNGYRKMRFKGFSVSQNEYEYVNFNNIWGIRNYSRAKHLKRALKPFVAATEKEKLIVVYSAHTPFLQAAAYAKRKDPMIKICLVVPDLPQYMNLSTKQSLLYRLGKKYDISKFNKLLPIVDSFMFLTEEMNKKLNSLDKPYIVVEGIVNEDELSVESNKSAKNEKYIVYAGKLYERFGINNLVRAFERIQEKNYRLILCGAGDSEEFIKAEAQKDKRICFMGQITVDEAKQWVSKADVLVNPRPNNEEYTKYSFPSKNIEYLATGKPVVAYMLDGMSGVYKDLMYVPQDNSIDSLTTVLIRACEIDFIQDKERVLKVKKHLKELNSNNVANKLIELTVN